MICEPMTCQPMIGWRCRWYLNAKRTAWMSGEVSGVDPENNLLEIEWDDGRDPVWLNATLPSLVLIPPMRATAKTPSCAEDAKNTRVFHRSETGPTVAKRSFELPTQAAMV